MGGIPSKDATPCDLVFPGYVQIERSDIREIGWAQVKMSESPQFVSKRECTAADLKGLYNGYRDQQLLVHIHGYNTEFEQALQSAAELKTRLGFAGPVLCIDWVSRGRIRGYTPDETTADAVVDNVVKVLDELLELPGPVHFLAHSMGNRVLLGAFHNFLLANSAREEVFGEVFLAAPDVNCDVFCQRVLDAQKLSGKLSPSAQYPSSVTVYTNGNDIALALSQLVHKDQRAGKGMAVHGTIDTIDCEDVRDVLGHSYYSEPAIVRDITEKIKNGTPAKRRCHLKPGNGDNAFRLAPADKKGVCVIA